MTDPHPDYSRRIVRRRQVGTAAMGVCFVAVTSSLLVALHQFLFTGRPIDPEDAAENLTAAGVVVVSALIGVVATALGGYFAEWLHRHLWPEHPDEG